MRFNRIREKINRERLSKISIVTIGFSIMLISFQNCSPVGFKQQSTDDGLGASQSVSSTIDLPSTDISSTEISSTEITNPSVKVASDTSCEDWRKNPSILAVDVPASTVGSYAFITNNIVFLKGPEISGLESKLFWAVAQPGLVAKEPGSSEFLPQVRYNLVSCQNHTVYKLSFASQGLPEGRSILVDGLPVIGPNDTIDLYNQLSSLFSGKKVILYRQTEPTYEPSELSSLKRKNDNFFLNYFLVKFQNILSDKEIHYLTGARVITSFGFILKQSFHDLNSAKFLEAEIFIKNQVDSLKKSLSSHYNTLSQADADDYFNTDVDSNTLREIIAGIFLIRQIEGFYKIIYLENYDQVRRDKELLYLHDNLIILAEKMEQIKTGDCRAPSRVFPQFLKGSDVNGTQPYSPNYFVSPTDAIITLPNNDESLVRSIRADKSFIYSNFKSLDSVLSNVNDCRDYIFRNYLQPFDIIVMMSEKHTGAVLNSGQILSTHYTSTINRRVPGTSNFYSGGREAFGKADLVIKCERGFWVIDPILSKCTAL